ncbi:phage major capsid protein [Ponticaulis koreensis]|uniref:phage major capsid protein n=1 Tax=Ponticaulis koreensis TaxID=1123045 RepID=UPI0003B77487|nr:phage major capsid protein [Ponticaulis koreensis]
MLNSVKISHRQSEIRQSLAALVGKTELTDDETRSMESLDNEYRQNETKYRAALISEDEERREAGKELETRSDREWSNLMTGFEMRQVALALDEGRSLDGRTAEIVSELRSKGGYRGMPVPWEALELRAGETVASGTPDPIRTVPIIDRLFASSVAAQMGASMINIDSGEVEYPVTSSSVAAGWANGETANVAGPSAYATVDRPLAPDNTLGIQMRLTRKSLKQSGAGLEQAVRRDMNGAISEALDAAVFQGSGSAGEPTGILAGASGWSITETDVSAAADYSVFRAAAVRFMTANAASGTQNVNLLLRPEIFDSMDADLISGTAVSQWDRLTAKIGKVILSSNALAAPTGDPAESSAILTTSVGGVPPIYVGTWGAIDLIRDPFSDAQSGGLRLTALTTMDVTISRAVQIEVLTGLQ